MQVIIREAKREDLEQIRALYQQPDFHGLDMVPLEQSERIFEQMAGYPYYKVFVAEYGDQIAGTFTLAILPSLTGDFAGVIEDVVVKSECRGQSVGEKMMRFALEQGKKAGCYKVALSSNVKRDRAHKFYESLGFEKHGYSFVTEM